ncbi:MAG: hypothetical protein Q4P65_00075 [Eubacteriales bacterium]|nr:hypothetical protein [Eubacteriales bacterium]
MKLKRVLALVLVLFITLATSSVLAQPYASNRQGIPKCQRRYNESYYLAPRVFYPNYYSYPIVRTRCARVTVPETYEQVTVCSRSVVYPYVPVLYVLNPDTYQVVPLYRPYRAPDIDYFYKEYSGCKKFK